MDPASVLALITFLDELFNLGGTLVQAAIQKEPTLLTTPLPDLTDMDKARSDAEAKITK